MSEFALTGALSFSALVSHNKDFVLEMAPKQKNSNDHGSIMCICTMESCCAISLDR